jgi:hypothetical protein
MKVKGRLRNCSRPKEEAMSNYNTNVHSFAIMGIIRTFGEI